MTLNKNRQEIQTHRSTLELLFLAHCFLLLSYIFPRIINKWANFEKQLVSIGFSSLRYVLRLE